MPKLPEQEKTEGLDYPEQKELITFSHQYKGLEKSVSVWLEPNLGGGSGNAIIEILDNNYEDDDEMLLGEITGFYKEDGNSRSFFVVVLNNTTQDRKGSSAVPRIVGSTITQLVTRGLITEWHSSHSELLSPKARDMYENFLGSNSDLNVQRPSEEYPAYIVTAKN